MNTKYAKRI